MTRVSKNFIIWFCAILFLFRAFPCQAQTLSLSLWPPLLEVMIQPGRSVTQVYKLTNNSDHALQITPVIYPFEALGETGTIRIKNPLQGKQEARIKNQVNFFSFDTGEKFNQLFIINVGETKNIVFRITVSRDNPENDYYYTLLFSTSQTEEEGQTKAASITQIGSNILLTVSKNGQPPLLGRIIKFSSPTIIDSFSPVDFEIVLENWGKTFWKPFGKIKIEGILKQKDEIPLLEQNILANSSRRLTIEPFKPKLSLGPFKAKVEFSLNENGQKLYTTTIFWYLPIKLLIGLAVFLIFVIVLKKIRHILTKIQNAS